MRRDILKEQKAAVADMGTSVYGLKNEIKLLNEKNKIKHHQQIKEKIETKINKYSLGRILPN